MRKGRGIDAAQLHESQGDGGRGRGGWKGMSERELRKDWKRWAQGFDREWAGGGLGHAAQNPGNQLKSLPTSPFES